jgi:type I restriction enzyme S subunit
MSLGPQQMNHPRLPEGWVWTTLGELGDYFNGRGFRKDEWKEDGRPIIRIQNLTNPSKPFNYFQGEVDERHVVQPGDILVSWAATLDVFRWDGPEAVVNQHIFKVQSRIAPDLHYWLLLAALSEVRARAHGTGMVHVTRDRFLETPVPLPPADEQRDLVAWLEDAWRNIDAGRTEVEGALRNLDRLRASILATAVADGVEGTIDDVVVGFEAGKSFQCQGRPADVDEWGVIKVSAMTYGDFRAEENKAVLNEEAVDPRWEIKENDLLISRANTAEYVGASTLVGDCRPRLLLSDKSLRVLPNEHVDRRWLNYALRAPSSRAQMSVTATGTSDSMRNLSQDKIRRLKVRIPAPEAQIELADEITARLSEIRDLEAAIDVAARSVHPLKQSVLISLVNGRTNGQ